VVGYQHFKCPMLPPYLSLKLWYTTTTLRGVAYQKASTFAMCIYLEIELSFQMLSNSMFRMVIE